MDGEQRERVNPDGILQDDYRYCGDHKHGFPPPGSQQEVTCKKCQDKYANARTNSTALRRHIDSETGHRQDKSFAVDWCTSQFKKHECRLCGCILQGGDCVIENRAWNRNTESQEQ